MGKIKKRFLVLIILTSLFSFFGAEKVDAAGEPYTIDQAPLTPPTFDDYTVVPVTTLAELAGPVYNSSATKVIYELQNDITMTGQILVNGDKAINLNGHTLNAGTAGYFLIGNGSTTNQFKIYNGTIKGGPTSTSPSNYGVATPSSAFLNAHYSKRANIVFEDITYNSNTNGGNFFDGIACNIFSLGTVNVSTFAQNIRAGNMTFLGDFNGTAFGQGYPNADGNGYGGVNLSFAGYAYSYINTANNGNVTMTQTTGDRRMYIGKDSHVVLKNTNSGNNAVGYLAYSNNIGNFAVLNIDGSLEATAVGTSLRTTASSTNNGRSYTNQAGTYNGQSNIYVNEGAKFNVSSTHTDAQYGTLFTYNTNLYSYKPSIFDMRYFGTGNFFYSWAVAPYSNMYLYHQNIGVWAKASKGIGNPKSIWQDVDSMSLLTFNINANGATNVKSSDSTLNASTFTINDYSRISNDVELPMLIPDETFVDDAGKTFLNNGDTIFNGSTDYYLPGDIRVGKGAPNATVKFVLDGKTYTTTTDSEGNWAFSDLDLSKVKGGTVGTLDITDDDKRVGTQIKVTIKDTIPPVATPKLIKVALGDTTALQDAKTGVATSSDETTTTANLKYEFVTSAEDRTNMINKLGSYTVDIKVTDEAGNTTTVTAPVIVHPPGETITDGLVIGNDFNIDYNTWLNATDEEKRAFLIDETYGSVKGYAISGNEVTEVTNDPSKMTVTMPTSTWEPNKTYEVSVKVNSYTKKIKVTLIPSAVKMTIKQVYKGTDTPIYSNLETKLTVDNTNVYEEEIGDDLETLIADKVSAKTIALNYEGYDTITVSDYKIYQNGAEVTPKPTTVPNEDFTIVYEYNGQLKFKEVAENLNFGTIAITDTSSTTSLTDTSDSLVSIINTEQNEQWRLKASVPDGIKQDVVSTPKTFLGNILYKDESGAQYTLGKDALVIENQKDADLLSQISLKNGEAGMFLEQNAGNLKGSYSGKLLWTLEDAPTP